MAKLNEVMSRLRLNIAVPQSANPDGNEKILRLNHGEYNDILESLRTRVAEIKAKLMNGTLNVFDTATFTVNGTKLETYMANVNFEDDGTGKDNNKADTQVIENGVFFESKHRSAPYFDVEIDGIKLLDRKY